MGIKGTPQQRKLCHQIPEHIREGTLRRLFRTRDLCLRAVDAKNESDRTVRKNEPPRPIARRLRTRP